MNDFFKHLKYNYSQRQTIRFFMFTYPKTTSVLGLVTFVALSVVCLKELKKIENFNNSFRNTVYSNDNSSKRNKTILIYDGELNNKK